MKKIAIIIPYFGTLPPIFSSFILTAEHNPTIDFLIFTDQKLESIGNIHVYSMHFSEMQNRVKAIFDFPIALHAPYKLCDYKPAYGEIFADYLKTYDFWGYCDVDLLLGDIRKFFTEDVLENHERFMTAGHLSLFKNCPRMNTLYKFQEAGGYPALNYQQVYTSDDSWYFDEARGLWPKCMLNEIRVFNAPMRDPRESEEKFYHNSVCIDNQFVIYWENGHLYAVKMDGSREELLYAHFFRRKFSTETISDTCKSIKVIPGKIIANKEIAFTDFEISEGTNYKIKYHISNLRKSIRRYGLRKTIWRQKWSRDHNQYLENLNRNTMSD